MLRSLSFPRRVRPLAVTAAAAAALVVLPVVALPAAAATSTPRPLGIDVSRWQSAGPAETCSTPGIAWSKVATTSRSFVFIRATRTKAGVTSADACFRRNWSGATDHRMYRGAYHYAIPSRVSGSATRDARAFVAVTGRMQGAGDLPPVLDLETSGGLTPAQLASWTRTWLTTVRSLTGRQPMIYTYPSFWRTAMADSSDFHAYPLWIANWTKTPTIPGQWPTYTVHQYSATGRVSGISGDVDLNVFNGSAWALRTFAHLGTAATVSTSGPVAYRGSGWRVSGVLRDARGAAARGELVSLYRKGATGAFTRIASLRTSATDGSYRFVVRPTAAASYQVRYNGGTALAASTSATVSHSIRDRIATLLTSTATPATVHPNELVRLSGSLSRATSGTRMGGRTLSVYQRVGSGPWTKLRTVHTSTTAGRYVLSVRPERTASYRVAFAGSVGYLATTSPVVTVQVS